jgi:hypothetical protein
MSEKYIFYVFPLTYQVLIMLFEGFRVIKAMLHEDRKGSISLDNISFGHPGEVCEE